jgi:phage tail tape-measure protein
MKRRIVLTLIFSTCFLYGCATYRPVVDTQNIISMDQYKRDTLECQEYARRVSPGAATIAGAGIGAGIGALAGLIVGATLGVDSGQLAGFGAAVGGLHGALSGGSAAAQSQMEIIKNCLRNRGYAVLN